MDNTIETQINKIVAEILDDYEKDRTIDNRCSLNQPDKSEIIEILNKLQQIIFSGYFKNKLYRVYTARNNLTMLLEDVMFHLSEQIMLVIKCSPNFKNMDFNEMKAYSHNVCIQFLKKIPVIREYIETDVEAAYDGDPAAYSMDEIIFCYPGLYAIFVNRIAHELYSLSIPLIPRIMTEYAHSITGIDIHPGATIGKYFFIDHGTGIVIGETTIIGDNVKIYQGVTLGALSTKGGQKLKNRKRHPTIEDNVTIYSGASILGGETIIGKDAVIGGNAFITKSIPVGTKVSIKNQELSYNYDFDTGNQKKVDLEQGDNWYYMI